MYKQRLIWTDFNDVTHTEDVYFNMMVPEFADLNFDQTVNGDLGDWMRKGMKEGSGETIHTMFKLLVSWSYGRRSEDGTAFTKTPEATKAFMESRAWEQMFLWLTEPDNDWKNAGTFWEGIFPEAMREQYESVQKAAGEKDITTLSKEELVELYKKSIAEKKASA